MKNIYREACIILPAAPDLAPPSAMREWAAATDAVTSALLANFGGWTRAEIVGAWRDPAGRDHVEAGLAYTVAVPAFTAPRDASGIVSHGSERAFLDACTALRRIARDACNAFSQQCIYLRLPSGDVSFIGRDGACVYGTENPSYPHAAEFWRNRAHKGG